MFARVSQSAPLPIRERAPQLVPGIGLAAAARDGLCHVGLRQFSEADEVGLRPSGADDGSEAEFEHEGEHEERGMTGGILNTLTVLLGERSLLIFR